MLYLLVCVLLHQCRFIKSDKSTEQKFPCMQVKQSICFYAQCLSIAREDAFPTSFVSLEEYGSMQCIQTHVDVLSVVCGHTGLHMGCLVPILHVVIFFVDSMLQQHPLAIIDYVDLQLVNTSTCIKQSLALLFSYPVLLWVIGNCMLMHDLVIFTKLYPFFGEILAIIVRPNCGYFMQAMILHICLVGDENI